MHFGWAPGARAAHAMFSRVAKFGEESADVTGEGDILIPPRVVRGPGWKWQHVPRARPPPPTLTHTIRASVALPHALPNLPSPSTPTLTLTSSPKPAVDDFELLSDCKACATLQLRPGAGVDSWDAVVSAFVDSL